MEEKTQIKILVICAVLLITFSVIYYSYIVGIIGPPPEKFPPSLNGELRLLEKNESNNSYKFNVTLSTSTSPKPLNRDRIRMHMYVTYKNGTVYPYAIFRHEEGQNESEAFSFSYIDENEDDLISTGDSLIVSVNLNLTEIKDLDFSFGAKKYAGTISGTVKVNSEKYFLLT